MVWTRRALSSWARSGCSSRVDCWRSRSTSAAPTRCGRWRGRPGGPASSCARICSAGRATRWPAPRRPRDRSQGARARSAVGPDRRIQGVPARQRAAPRGSRLPAAARRGRAAGAGDRGGRRVVAVRQPGGTPVADAARKLALQFPHEVAPVAELFLFLAARADLVHHVIRPALDEGQVVVADRFDLSTIAYQVAGAGLPAAEVAQTIRLATGRGGPPAPPG